MKWLIALVGGIAVAIIGLMLAKDSYVWLRQARSSTGTVIELIPHESRSQRDRPGHRIRSHTVNTTYAPRVRYTAHDGTQHEFQSGMGSNPPDYRVGETVWVAYHADTYDGRILTFGQCFGLAAGLAIMGTGCAALSVIFLIGRQLVPRVYLKRN